MSVTEKGFCVRLLEKEYRVGCPKEHERALKEAGEYLDKHMRNIRQSGRVIGVERIMFMAALQITFEYLSLKQATEENEIAFSDRIRELQDKIDLVLDPKPLIETLETC
jgi:cell division protein ZapA